MLENSSASRIKTHIKVCMDVWLFLRKPPSHNKTIIKKPPPHPSLKAVSRVNCAVAQDTLGLKVLAEVKLINLGNGHLPP